MIIASEKGSDFIQDLGDAARKNPLSAALIGMGILWLFAGGRPVERVGEFARSSGLDRIPDAAGNVFDAARSTLRSGSDAVSEGLASVKDVVKDGVVETLESANRSGREYANSASEYVTSIPGSGAEVFDNVRSNLTGLFRDQPLALGALGIAIGAGIAAALPRTEIETDYLGASSKLVRENVAQFAADQSERATTIAEKVVDAVKEEAAAQGLTLEGGKAAAADVSAKVSRVVNASGKRTAEPRKL